MRPSKLRHGQDLLQTMCLFPIAGLYPLADSFELTRSDYLRSLGFNDSYVDGYTSQLQANVLNKIPLSYCFAGDQVTCDAHRELTTVCKVWCKSLAD